MYIFNHNVLAKINSMHDKGKDSNHTNISEMNHSLNMCKVHKKEQIIYLGTLNFGIGKNYIVSWEPEGC